MSPYLCYVLLTALIVAASATYQGKDLDRVERKVKGNDGLREHDFTQDACKNIHFAKMFASVMSESKCSKPLPTMVALERPSETSVYIPNKVKVKRCQGMCYTHQDCIPSESKNIVLSVREQNLVTHEVTCGMVTVEEHITCMCKCNVMKEHCNHLQTYIQSQCKCECMKPELMYECLKDGKKWNDGICKCECPRRLECTTGQSWDPQSCMCMEDDVNGY